MEEGAGLAGEVELAAEGFYAFSHAAQTVAFAGAGVVAVVLDGEAVVAAVFEEAEAAGCGFRVTDNVGDGFAEGEGRGRFLRRR